MPNLASNLVSLYSCHTTSDWIIDSRATNHMTYDYLSLESPAIIGTTQNSLVGLPNGTKLHIRH